jgi:23S rRNA pseudouridine1911/1915/1917 synthase
MRTLRFTVADADAGSRLDRALAARAEIGTRSLAERLLASGSVLVDGSERPKSHRLDAGSKVEVSLPEPDETEPQPGAVTVPVVYGDAQLVVLDKPAGVAVHPGAGTRSETLLPQLLALGATGGGDPERPGVVHRLDRDTSGLLIVARSDESYRLLQEAIRRRRVERRYLALVRGHPGSRTGRIDAPIGRDRRERTMRSLDTDEPREAITYFEIVELLPEHTLLEARLETGRTHQIRVHLAAIGLPVAGDPRYGVAGDLGLRRQFLHAFALRFEHPSTGEEVALTSELPPDLESALELARVR